ncbi:hypothetical protein IQ252_08385 [Tychonema sp. LEGE 07203]|nr:hypothetical protein [Tychonema sp. LEGE 07203]
MPAVALFFGNWYRKRDRTATLKSQTIQMYSISQKDEVFSRASGIGHRASGIMGYGIMGYGIPHNPIELL